MGLVAVHATKPEAQNHCERDVEYIHCNPFASFCALKTGRVRAYAKINPIMVPADKGKTTVTTYSDDYSNKVHVFLPENNFQTLQKTPNDKY
jgi:hypothetical protein